MSSPRRAAPGLLLVASTATAQPPRAAGLDTVAVERVLRQEMRATRTPGASIAVVRRGRVVWQRGFGVASVETQDPVTAQTLFRIGSTTKMVTGLAASVLAHEGKVRLDAPLAAYARNVPPTLGRLTLDQLLTHRAGLVNEASADGPHDDAALGARVRGWGREHLIGPPADVYSYSGPGYWLAGYAIEQAGGAWYADVVKQRVLAPLGMTRSTFRPLEAMTWPMAQDHRVRDTVAAVLRPYADDVTTWASGSLFSSAAELARLAIAIMDRGRVGGAQAVPAAAVATLVEPRAPVPGGEGCRYAYGLSACVRGGVRTLSHYGFRVGSGSVVTMAPDSQAAVIVLANRNGGILAGTAAAVMAQLVGAAGADVAARPDSAPRAPIDARRFVGRYANGRDTVQVLQRPTGLAYRYGAAESPARLDDAGALLVLDAKGEPVQRWVLVAGAVSRTPYLHDGLNAFARVR